MRGLATTSDRSVRIVLTSTMGRAGAVSRTACRMNAAADSGVPGDEIPRRHGLALDLEAAADREDAERHHADGAASRSMPDGMGMRGYRGERETRMSAKQPIMLL